MDESNPIPHASRATPISDDEAARLIAAAPVAADAFAVLSRRGGRPMTDEQIAEFLSDGGARPGAPGAPGGLADLPPLPVAQVVAVPPRPAPVLGYAPKPNHDDRYSDPRDLAYLPVAFRVLRVAPWVAVALFMLYAMTWKILRG